MKRSVKVTLIIIGVLAILVGALIAGLYATGILPVSSVESGSETESEALPSETFVEMVEGPDGTTIPLVKVTTP